LKDIIVQALPKTASLIDGLSHFCQDFHQICAINWCAIIKARWYFLASDKISQNVSVAKFWNSSTYMKKSFLSDSGISALDMAAIFIFDTNIKPKSCAFKAQILPFDKFTKRIFLLSIISLILKADFGCQIIFLIVVFVIKGPNLEEK
jgi:hypothetical protein